MTNKFADAVRLFDDCVTSLGNNTLDPNLCIDVLFSHYVTTFNYTLPDINDPEFVKVISPYIRVTCGTDPIDMIKIRSTTCGYDERIIPLMAIQCLINRPTTNTKKITADQISNSNWFHATYGNAIVETVSRDRFASLCLTQKEMKELKARRKSNLQNNAELSWNHQRVMDLLFREHGRMFSRRYGRYSIVSQTINSIGQAHLKSAVACLTLMNKMRENFIDLRNNRIQKWAGHPGQPLPQLHDQILTCVESEFMTKWPGPYYIDSVTPLRFRILD